MTRQRSLKMVPMRMFGFAPKGGYPFGSVFRRDWDHLTIMVIGYARQEFVCDESISIGDGEPVGLVIDKGRNVMEDVWPLFGTCELSSLVDEGAWKRLP